MGIDWEKVTPEQAAKLRRWVKERWASVLFAYTLDIARSNAQYRYAGHVVRGPVHSMANDNVEAPLSLDALTALAAGLESARADLASGRPIEAWDVRDT